MIRNLSIFCCQGNIGILDVSTRGYTTVMRSHTARVVSMSLDPSRRPSGYSRGGPHDQDMGPRHDAAGKSTVKVTKKKKMI